MLRQGFSPHRLSLIQKSKRCRFASNNMGRCLTSHRPNLSLSNLYSLYLRKPTHHLRACRGRSIPPSWWASIEDIAMPISHTLAAFDQSILWTPIPIPGDGHVARDAQSEYQVCESDSVAVTQIELATPVHADRINAVAIPITGHWLVAGQPVVQANICRAGGVCVGGHDHPVARAEDSG